MKLRQSTKESTYLTLIALIMLLAASFRFKEILIDYNNLSAPIENFTGR